MGFAAIIVAAGAGARAGEGLAKQWRDLGGKPVLRWSADAFAGAEIIVVVVAPGEEERARDALAGLTGWRLAQGGATRDVSVRNGLAALGDCAAERVLVHDAARPFVEDRHIQAVLAALETAEGAAPVLPVADTLKRDRDSGAGATTVARDGLWRAQTPQAFRLASLRAAYEAWNDPVSPTDDAQVVERAGGAVALVPGDPMLFKLTYPGDFAMARRLAAANLATRIGQGFDAHRFGPGDAVWLCGVRIGHDRALIGHSDADAGLHALTDALLGALGEGDIGDHFPPEDPQWKGAASDQFLRHAANLVAARGGRIVNVDVTLLCEAPRIKPHRQAMRGRIAEILAIPLDAVSVKATTTEKMGFLGRGEGLAAQAVASIALSA